MNQHLLPTTNVQPDTIPAHPEPTSMLCQVELNWFADPDGVHRYAQQQAGVSARAAVFPEIPGVCEWLASKGNRVRTGVAPTLELAKEAAERAVAQMDEEGA